MEDIKRCEELIKEEHSYWIGISNQKAIENLLKQYKELEEELESEKFYHNADKEFIQKYHDEASELNTKCINLETQLSNSVPTSVIQNKIDELKSHNYKGNLGDVDFIKNIINEFEELLEERNK